MDFKKVYQDAFALPKYCQHSVLEFRYQFALDVIERMPDRSIDVLDVGAGRGNFYKAVQDAGATNITVTEMDLDHFSGNDVKFIEADLTNSDCRADLEETGPTFNAIVCLDMLEHLPEHDAIETVDLLSSMTEFTVAVTVANHSDKKNGIELHLTQRPMDWWEALFKECEFMVMSKKRRCNNRLYAFELER